VPSRPADLRTRYICAGRHPGIAAMLWLASQVVTHIWGQHVHNSPTPWGASERVCGRPTLPGQASRLLPSWACHPLACHHGQPTACDAAIEVPASAVTPMPNQVVVRSVCNLSHGRSSCLFGDELGLRVQPAGPPLAGSAARSPKRAGAGDERPVVAVPKGPTTGQWWYLEADYWGGPQRHSAERPHRSVVLAMARCGHRPGPGPYIIHMFSVNSCSGPGIPK